MTCGNYLFLLLDTCFIAQLRRVDPSCELIEFFGPCSNATCVIKRSQYSESPCNHFEPDCTDLDDIFSDEESILANMRVKNKVDFTRIYTDPTDVKMFLWAYQTDNTAIWTCDKTLLDLCRQHNIPKSCFKAAIKAVDQWLNGEIMNSTQYNIKSMENGDDPFYHYSNNRRCESHCGLKNSCICFKQQTS